MIDPRQNEQIAQNYDAFQRMLGVYLQQQRDRYALMRDSKVVGFFDDPDSADLEGTKRFSDRIYSIQQVVDEPIELGIYAHGLG